MISRIDLRLAKVEARRLPAPLAEFSLTELCYAKRELEASSDGPPSPLLFRLAARLGIEL